MEKVLEFARTLITNKKSDKLIAIDATCGRGNDTMFLAEQFDTVYAFDIQDDAIESTTNRMHGFNNVRIVKDSNVNICTYLKEADVVMYNLGYLPNGDKSITTNSVETIKSLTSVLGILKKDGLVTIVCYPGHSEGMKEAIELEKYLQELNQKEFDVIKYDFINQINNPPFLFAIQRR